eukprot:12908975-Prorocentrum_lima.AAC.1
MITPVTCQRAAPVASAHWTGGMARASASNDRQVAVALAFKPQPERASSGRDVQNANCSTKKK